MLGRTAEEDRPAETTMDGSADPEIRNGRFDLFRKSIDGGVEELLYSDADDKYPTSWSPDGKFLLFDRLTYQKPNSIRILPRAGNLAQCSAARFIDARRPSLVGRWGTRVARRDWAAKLLISKAF
jgi:hypothetical protein